MLSFTATLSGTAATFSGDAADDTLVIDMADGLLRHNRFGLDAGYFSSTDFDTSKFGVQTLPAGSGTTLTVNAGDGTDSIQLGTASVPLAAIAATFSIRGDAGEDTLSLESAAERTGRTIGIGSSAVSGFRAGHFVLYSTVELLDVSTGSGADTFSIASTLNTLGIFNKTNISSGGGDDIFNLGNNGVLSNLGNERMSLSGGDGTDTINVNGAQEASEATLDITPQSVILSINSTQKGWSYAAERINVELGPADNEVRIHSSAIVIARTNAGDDKVVINLAGTGTNGGTLDGGAGNDTLIYRLSAPPPAPSVVIDLAAGTASRTAGIAGFENAFGGSGNDRVVGTSEANALQGGDGNDTLIGLGGDDTLAGGFDSDSLDGGGGQDLLREHDLNTSSVASPDGDPDIYAGGLGTDTLDLSYVGSASGVGVNITVDDVANDSGGDNVRSDIEVLLGTRLADTLVGSSGRNTLHGNAGNDFIDGQSGDDSLDGGTGADVVFGGAGNDTAAASATSSEDFIDLGDGQDGVVFYGTDGNDRITISRRVRPDGAQVVIRLNNQTFVNTYRNGETVSVFGGAGNDRIVKDESAFTWQGFLFGEAGNDRLWGADTDDLLDGGRGNDRLFGGGGDDTLVGGPGKDKIHR